jgi:hypothetical protein
MAGEELITREEGVASINAAQLDQLLHPTLDPNASAKSSPKACRPRRGPLQASSCSTPTRRCISRHRAIP